MFRPMTLSFILVYTAAMGSLIVISAPILQNVSSHIIKFILLPMGVIGMAAIVMLKFMERRQDSRTSL
jgi:hypothetical protein